MIRLDASILTLIAGTLTTALITGLFYAYSVSVNPGVKNLTDAEYLSAMQSINKAILNPLFFLSFMGTLVLLPVSSWLLYRTGASISAILLMIAAIVYIFGSFGVTIFCNVPLNEALDHFDIHSASGADITNAREKFELPWNQWHTVRTMASLISLILTVLACLNSQSKY